MSQPGPVEQRTDAGRAAVAEALQASFRLLLWGMLLVALAYAASGVFIVREHERAYVLVFGRISGYGADRIKTPGLHWTWPKPIAEIVRVPAERIQSMEVDTHWFEQLPLRQWETRPRAGGPTLRPLRDGYVLTGDANIIHVRWGVRYTVRDPETYLFRIADAERILHKELDRATALVAQQWAVDTVLRADVEGFRGEVDRRVRERLHAQGLGVDLHRLDILAMTPPLQVAAAFESVIEAEQDRSRAISAARAYAVRVTNDAQGQAARIEAEANAARQRIMSVAEADADLFTSLLAAYQLQPVMMTQTLWQDRIRRALPRVDRQLWVYEREDGKREVRIPVGF